MGTFNNFISQSALVSGTTGSQYASHMVNAEKFLPQFKLYKQ